MINFGVISTNAITVIAQENLLHHSQAKQRQPWEKKGTELARHQG